MKHAKAPKYLVCVDAREESGVALRLVCMKAKARHGTVDMLHVITPADFQTLGAVADRMREEKMQEARHLLKKLADAAEETYGVKPHVQIKEGQVGDEIVAATANPDVIMLAIGIAKDSSNRGTLATWLAGQLGHKLLVPLLMVPGNLTDEQLEKVV